MKSQLKWSPILSSCVSQDGTIQAEAMFRAGHPWFDGHFPGQPILPGVASLGLLETLLLDHAATGCSPFICGLKRTKFKAAISPDTPLAVSISPAKETSPLERAFRISAVDKIASQGILTLRDEDEDSDSNTRLAVIEFEEGSTPPLEEILPHRNGMLLLQNILSVQEDSAHAIAVLSDRTPLFHNGVVSPILVIELVAQTIGCCLGLTLRKQGTDKPSGMIAGLKNATFRERKLPVGIPLIVRTQIVRNVDFYAVARGYVETEDRFLGEAELQIIQMEYATSGKE